MLRIGWMLRIATRMPTPMEGGQSCPQPPFRRLAAEPVVEGADGQDHRQRIQPGEIAARKDEPLEGNGDGARDGRDRLRQEVSERDHQLREMVEQHAGLVEPGGRPMKEPTQRTRHGPGLIVIVEAREIAPARVAAHLGEPRAEHQAEQQPSQQPDGDGCGVARRLPRKMA